MRKNMPSSNELPRARLHEASRHHGKSLAELSRVIGRNPAYLQQYVTRGSPRRLDRPDVCTIAEYLGIAPEALDPAALGDPGAPPPRRGDWREIPRLALDASAGPGAIGAQEIPYDTIRFSRRWLREMGLENADLSAIRVEGDSMEPELRSGDEIFVDRNKRAGEGIFVVRIGDALHVKQLRLGAADRIVLVSVNTAYPPVHMPRTDVTIIGRVVWKGGRV